MILFTKEVFVQLKTINSIQVRAERNVFYRNNNQETEISWRVSISGTWANVTQGYDLFENLIECASKEDAYRIYKDLMQQVVESGEISQLTDKQFEEVLKEET